MYTNRTLDMSFVHCCVHCCGLQMSHVSLSFPLISLSGHIVLSQSSLLNHRPMFILVSLFLVCLLSIVLSRVLYNTLFSREENFAKSEFEIFSREDILANLLFTRKYLPAKISSRENILSRKYPPAKIVCLFRQRIASFSLFAARWSGTPVAGLTLDPEFASHRRNNGIIPTISNLDRSYI